MDETNLESQIEEVVDTTPASTQEKTKKKITYKQVPMASVIGTQENVEPAEPATPSAMVNTTRPEAGKQATQHVNSGFPDSVKLVSSGGDAYIGGSVSPNSSVRAALRPMDQHAGDPFWLESTDRFVAVNPWTVNLPILKEGVKLTTVDPDKAAYYIANHYQGIADNNFVGYEYVPLEDYHETAWSAFWGDYERTAAETSANTYSATAGLLDEEEAKKTPEQRAEENRTKGGWFRRKGQQYLDYINQLEPLPRKRDAVIAGGAGSGLFSFLPALAAIPLGPFGWVAGALGGTALSASETLGTRDAVLKSGGTVNEAQNAQWAHLGAIGVTEMVSDLTGNAVARGLTRAAINHGASRMAAEVVGAGTQATVGGGLDATTEVIQDKVGRIVSGQDGLASLFGWTREDWNTFYSTLLLGALRIPGGAISGRQEFDTVANVSDNYTAMSTKLIQTMVDKAEKSGHPVSPEVVSALQDLAIKIYEDPEGMFDADMRNVAQGLFDKLQNLDPEVVERARALMESNPNFAQNLSEQAFKDFDNRVRSQPWFAELNNSEQQVVLGQLRGMAYIGAFFFGQSPSDIKLPTFRRMMYDGKTSGTFAARPVVERKQQKLSDQRNSAISEIQDRLPDKRNSNAAFRRLDSLVELDEIQDDNPVLQEVVTALGRGGKQMATRYIEATRELNKVNTLLNETQSGVVFVAPRDTSYGAGTVSAYDSNVKGDYNYNTTNPVVHNLVNLLHEFSHANDWQLNDKQINDLSGFAEWYTSAISEVFGKQRGNAVAGRIRERSGTGDTLGFKESAYKSTKNVTENRAQAVGRLLRKAKDYIGLTGKPAEYIQAVNALLQGMDEEMPLPNGLSDYVAALQDYVKRNSEVIERIRNKVPADRMRAAIKAYMGGEDVINWQGVTPQTLEDFAKSVNSELDADALQYALDALGDTNIDDFVDRASRDWDLTWDALEEENPEAFPKTTTEKINDVRESEIDGGLDPEVITEDDIEDWEEKSNSVQQVVNPNYNAEILDFVGEVKDNKPSEFAKKVNKKFNGMTLEQTMDKFLDAIKQYKFIEGGVARASRFLDFIRGTPSFLMALGGEKLTNMFDLVNRYDDYGNMAAQYNEGLIQKLLPLFGGNRNRYEDYIRQSGVAKYKIKYVNPVTRETEERAFSKRELMSAILYDEQPDSKDRIAKTVDISEVRALLDDTDIKFAHTLRDHLRDDFRKVKGKNADKIPQQYFPIMDSYVQEKGETQIVNDIGRKNVDDPIGLVDVMNVMGGYMSRVAGTKSGYFAAIRRLNSVLNYNAKNETTRFMSAEDVELNERLDKKSAMIQREIKNRITAYNFDRMKNGVLDVIDHRNQNDLKDCWASIWARNSLATMLYGSLKQFSTNVGSMFSFLGYQHNSYGSYIFGLVKALAQPLKAWRLAMENPTIRNRFSLYRYNEYMEKNLSVNSDNMLTYLANWATKNDIRSIEAITDLLIHAGTLIKKVLAAPLRYGDILGIVLGYAASYDSAVKALGSAEEARRSLSGFISNTQSTSNQAVKGLLVKRANRDHFWGNFFAFTGESTQKWGTMARDINRMQSGDLSIEQGTRDIVAQTLTQVAYLAVQSGVVMALIAPLFGGKMSDDDWDKIYDNVFKEGVNVMAGMGGPLANIFTQPVLQEAIFGHDYNGSGLPAAALMLQGTKAIKKGNYVNPLMILISGMGIATGAPRAESSIEGIYEAATANTQKERNKGLWQAEGRSEGMAKYLSGAK